jgi:hypothetical protein
MSTSKVVPFETRLSPPTALVTITTPSSESFIIDAADYDRVSRHTWYVLNGHRHRQGEPTKYVGRFEKRDGKKRIV